MAKARFDGLVEGVHFAADGQVAWVRAYLRRGPTFSDCEILNRSQLVESLKAGKKFVFGERQTLVASTFTIQGNLRLIQSNGKGILVAGDAKADSDYLPGVPQI